uniref:Uncharacterized protein n=1 Tax=Oryza sativa subsp. japonica TaxID=39947 RepID=Q6ZI29_ORYSJ|nr:hypothetical protein [Oryza sativa Japonica Group]
MVAWERWPGEQWKPAVRDWGGGGMVGGGGGGAWWKPAAARWAGETGEEERGQAWVRSRAVEFDDSGPSDLMNEVCMSVVGEL